MYPVFLALKGKSCVIVGGGTVALRKACDLMEARADITIVAETPADGLKELSEDGFLKLKTKRFEPDDIVGAFLVIAATDNDITNTEIAKTARLNGILVNVVDTPDLCDFFTGATVKRGPLRIAISTSGCCPKISGQIRQELEELFPENYGDYIRSAGEMRTFVLSHKDSNAEKKQAALSWLAQKDTRALFFKSGEERIWQELKKLIST